MSHLVAVKRILCYVKGSIGYKIPFPAADTTECNLLNFIESNWCGDTDDRKYTTGYIFIFGCETNLLMFEEGTGSFTLIL